jgi:hypothetical protein
MWTTAGLTESAKALKFCGTIRTGAFLDAVAIGRPEPSINPTITITTMYFVNLNFCFIFFPLCFGFDRNWPLIRLNIEYGVNGKMTAR